MKSLIIGVNLNNNIFFNENLKEFFMLAESAGAVVSEYIVVKRDKPDKKYFIGKGKVEEISTILLTNNSIEVVLFDQPLSPSQQRNLESIWKVRVVDRISLILDIFALRAKSHEGKLQVELAQLEYLSTRLTRMWTHLERQRGGIGMRGPGESQLEMDRRIINDKVKILKDRIKKLRLRRDSQRSLREKNRAFSVSLVGYTNSGKSTLFNILAKENTYVADQLFATLDTTSRNIWINNSINKNIVLSDTVGFIRDLPHSLIDSFHATLYEASSADLLLHVVDVFNENYHEQIANVNSVIKEIGASNIPTIMVYNKIDLSNLQPRVEYDSDGLISSVFLSAAKNAGIDYLRNAIAKISNTVRQNVENFKNI
ncbi:GTP-binding protein HflX [Candidatus Kinetoplastibacterium desouzaii TCC079E]|uniref:GTPase HflX n=1 Tax=Candidatus Kinetoplastidibacterium desouzai TCC079E TaxID=1208919 RepID=M1LUF6_9PROT|nr:GTPase HflX [Candidatus Kinetoplastibacterium desouzaii]AGF46939.1 GTP-binding protein HflX [Candidatus Kinetoplastibacterium desouzaii TCC079E]